MVSSAIVHLVVLRDLHHLCSGHAGHRHVHGAYRDGTGVFDRRFRSEIRRRSASLSAPFLVLFSSGGLCDDSSRHGHHVGSGRLLLPEARLWIHRRCLFLCGDRRFQLSGVGPSHVHHGHLELFGPGVFLHEHDGGRPSAIKIFNWSATMYKGSISFDTPMLYAIGFIGLFTMGGLTGVFLASLGMDIHLTETYFIVAHFHYVMVGGMVSAVMAGLHFYWPKMTGRMYPESLGRLAAVVLFIGFNLTFFPQFILGYLGMPRRYHAYPPEFQVLNVFSTAGASILAIGYLMPIVYFLWSLRYGKIAGANPWQAAGLEWTVDSPPLTENFQEIPIVDFEAYDYRNLPPPRVEVAG